jgi:hypothetical protein
MGGQSILKKKILFALFFVLILFLSISSIQASDVNISDSSALSSNDVNLLQIENETNLESVGSDDLSTDMNDISFEENTKNQTELASQTDSIYYKGCYNVTLTDSNANATLANKSINFVINDVNYNVTTDDYGVASLNLNLKPGIYTVKVCFLGDNAYEYSSLTSTLEILPTIQANNITKYYNGSTQYSATFFDRFGNFLTNVTVYFTVNGVTYSERTDENGTVILPINLLPGIYEISTANPITGYALTTTVEVLSTISSSNLKKVQGDSRKFTAKFYNAEGKALVNKYVKITVNGKTYNVKTDSKGKATLSLNNFKPGKYEVICYNVDGLTKTYKIKIYKCKASTKLTTKFYTLFPNDKKQIKVKLKTQLNDDSNVGKTIKIKINGKTYYRVTDSEGIAYLSVASLKKGIYSVEYEYEGNKYFQAAKAKNFVTILENGKTALKVKSTRNFGYGAHTQLKVAFTADGVPLAKRTITFTINGKSYNKTTDGNGIASLTINLKIGSYTVNYKTYNQSKINETSGSFDITVFQRTVPKLIWKSGSSFKDNSQTFKLLCTDSKGRPASETIVELTIDHKTYTAKTNSKGYATFKTHVPIGKYKISIKSKSNNDFLDGHASKSVKVKLSKFHSGLNEKNVISHLKKYLKSSKHCKVGSSKIKKLVKSLTRGSSSKVNKAKAIFNYVRDTLSYSFYYDTKYGATGTLKHKKGNCVDHSHLLVSMYRTAGFKARYVHGTCKFNSGGVYGHVWTQVLIGKHWVCADATGYANQLGKINNWNTKSYKIHGKYASLPF